MSNPPTVTPLNPAPSSSTLSDLSPITSGSAKTAGSPSPRVKVLTLFTENYAPLAKVTLPRIQQWAARWNYELIVGDDLDRPDLNPSWNKLALISKTLQPDEIGIWMDIDILVIDPHYDLTACFPTDECICFSSDNNGLCAGLFTLKGQWALDCLKTALFLGEAQPNTGRWEQDTFKHLIRHFSNVGSRCMLITEDVVQNPCSPFCKNPFAMHLWTSRWAMPEAVEGAKLMLDNWTQTTRDDIYRRRWSSASPGSTPQCSS